MKNVPLYRILLGTFTFLLLLLSDYTLCTAEWHLGEYILYLLTALCLVSFFSGVFPPKSERGRKTVAVLRKVNRILLGAFAAGGLLLALLCRTDNISYTEKYAIVLGAPVRTWGVSKALTQRVELAADFLRKDESAVAVLTGGNSPYKGVDENVSQVTGEGAYMAMALIAEGIAPERLYIETEAASTVENFQYSTDLLKEAGYHDGDTLVIITSRFHAYRVRELAKEAGVKNFLVLAPPMLKVAVFPWILREIPVSIAFFMKRVLKSFVVGLNC